MKQTPIEKCRIGHSLLKQEGAIVRYVLHWSPQGEKKMGRQRTTWERKIGTEMQEVRKCWREKEKEKKKKKKRNSLR
jgi:hypothetical protein